MNHSIEVISRDAASDAAPILRLDDFLPHRLNVLSSLVSQALTRVYGEYGIGIPEWRVLVRLGQFRVMIGKANGAPAHMHQNTAVPPVAPPEPRTTLSPRAHRAARPVPFSL